MPHTIINHSPFVPANILFIDCYHNLVSEFFYLAEDGVNYLLYTLITTDSNRDIDFGKKRNTLFYSQSLFRPNLIQTVVSPNQRLHVSK